MNSIRELDKSISAVCPIDGVSVGDKANKATWRIDFKDEATQPQRDAAQATVDAFVWDESPDPRTVLDDTEAEADKQDAQLLATLNMTDAQINAAINNAFTDPAQRTIIKRLARLAQHAARGKRLR